MDADMTGVGFQTVTSIVTVRSHRRLHSHLPTVGLTLLEL